MGRLKRAAPRVEIRNIFTAFGGVQPMKDLNVTPSRDERTKDDVLGMIVLGMIVLGALRAAAPGVGTAPERREA